MEGAEQANPTGTITSSNIFHLCSASIHIANTTISVVLHSS